METKEGLFQFISSFMDVLGLDIAFNASFQYAYLSHGSRHYKCFTLSVSGSTLDVRIWRL